MGYCNRRLQILLVAPPQVPFSRIHYPNFDPIHPFGKLFNYEHRFINDMGGVIERINVNTVSCEWPRIIEQFEQRSKTLPRSF